MKVLLINPPVRDFYNTPLRRLPLGLLYLAAALRMAGHDVSLLDSGAVRKARACKLPEGLKDPDLAAYAADTAPFRLFGRFQHFGPTVEQIEEFARRAAPEIAGISSLFTPYAAEVNESVGAVRRAAPAAAIVLGGGHPSAFPEAALAHSAADFAVAGEGEGAFVSLVDALAAGRDPAGTPGVARLREGRLQMEPPRFAADLDRLPLPARDLVDPAAYVRRGRPMTQILSSRGCPVGCAFCSARLTSGRRYRPRAPEAVVAEMIRCRDRHGTQIFDFEDDNLTLDRGRALRLMELIQEAFGTRGVVLEALNGLSAAGLDRPLLEALSAAGFERLHLAPLSAEPASLAAMKRPSQSLDGFLQTAEIARSLGLNVTAYVMVGFPGQTVHEIMTTADLIAGAGHRVTPSIFYPAAGSEIQKALMPEIDSSGPSAWGGLRSAFFPVVPGGLSRPVLRTLYWMVHLAAWAGELIPDRSLERLRALCAPTAAGAAPDAPHPPRQPWIVRSHSPLGGRGRGLEALAAFLRAGHPHGVRVLQKARHGGRWSYEVFPLPGLLEDRAFYRRWGVPGFR